MHQIRASHVLLCALGVIVVVGGGGYLVSRVLLTDAARAELPSTGDALHRVPVWLGDEGDLRLVLRPYYQRREADRADDALLSSRLFPGGSGAHFAVLWVFNYAKDGEVTFHRDETTLRLADAEGRPVAPLDLPAAVQAASLRPDLRLLLRIVHAADRHVTVPAGAYQRILLALPAPHPVLTLDRARIMGLDLAKRQVVRHRLESYLADPSDRASLLPGGS